MLHIIAATRSWRRLACKSCKSCLAVALLKQTPCKLKQAAHTWTARPRGTTVQEHVQILLYEKLLEYV